jgi:ankyrin repeat protein
MDNDTKTAGGWPSNWVSLIVSGEASEVEALLDQGADVHHSGDAAIQLAAENGQTETTLLLIKRGANIHINQDQPLRHAACNGHPKTLKLLLEHGARINAEGHQALRWASEGGRMEVLRVLFDHYSTKILKELARSKLKHPCIKFIQEELKKRMRDVIHKTRPGNPNLPEI